MSAISVASSSSLIPSIRIASKAQLIDCVRYGCRLKQLPSLGAIFIRYPNRLFKLRTNSKRVTRVAPVMEWQDCTVKMEVDVPASVAYNCYLDRESIPKWMPFISKVTNLEDKADMSRWSLKYRAFGQDIEFSWLARNLQPTPNQKIHWRSVEGLPNRGAVRFFPRGPSSCLVELTVSYEVPTILTPVASANRGGLSSFRTAHAKQRDEFLQLDAQRRRSKLDAQMQSERLDSTSGYDGGGSQQAFGKYGSGGASPANHHYTGSSYPMEVNWRYPDTSDNYVPSRMNDGYGEYHRQRREDFGRNYNRY